MSKYVKLAAAAAVAMGLSVGLSAAPASALVLEFEKITSNSAFDVSSQLSVVVSDAGTTAEGVNQVMFTTFNDVGLASSITGIHFDDGTLLGIASVASFGGASFEPGGTPANLPGGNNADPNFQTTAEFLATSDSGSPGGINSDTRRVEITFNLLEGMTFDDTIAALLQGPIVENGVVTDRGLRVGLRVQSHPDGDSDAYVNIPPSVVPLPAGLVLFLTGLAGVGFLGRFNAKRRREPELV